MLNAQNNAFFFVLNINDSYSTEKNLKGNIKFLKQSSYYAIDKFGEISKGDECYPLILGLYPNEVSFKQNNNPIKEFFNDKNPELIRTNIYKYNDLMKPVEYSNYDNSGDLVYKFLYTYNNKGLISETNSFLPNGNLDEKTIYKYNTLGKIAERSVYNPDGNLRCKWVNIYNDRGLLNEENYYYSDGRLYSKTTFDYDINGKIIGSNEIKYIEKRNRKDFYKYDSKGNVTENKYIIDETRTVLRNYKYEYDVQGNWIKLIYSENTIPQYIVEREIQYF